MGVFDRVRKRGAAAPAGQPAEDLWFEARCPAGHELTGRRLEEFQAVRCPECGEGIFILPTSWLPVPPAASPADLVSLSRIRETVSFEETGIDDEAYDEAPPPSGGPSPIPLKQADRQSPRKSTEMPVDDPAARYEVTTAGRVGQSDFEKIVSQDARRQAEAGEEARDSLKKKAKPAKPVEKEAAEEQPDDEFDDEFLETIARLPFYKRVGKGTWIGLAVASVIGLTFYIQMRQAHREKLPQLANLGRTQGMAKLDAGQFDEAKQILADAAAAYDEMRENSDEAKTIKKAALEAAIFADLVSRPLEEILDRVAADAAGLKEFEALDKGRSLIIESRITATPEKGGAYDIDYRVAVGPGPAPARPLGRLDLSGLKLLENLKPNVGDTILIGVRLKDLKLQDGTWWIRLDPESGVQLGNWKALAAIGWPVTDRPNENAADMSNAKQGARP